MSCRSLASDHVYGPIGRNAAHTTITSHWGLVIGRRRSTYASRNCISGIARSIVACATDRHRRLSWRSRICGAIADFQQTLREANTCVTLSCLPPSRSAWPPAPPRGHAPGGVGETLSSVLGERARAVSSMGKRCRIHQSGDRLGFGDAAVWLELESARAYPHAGGGRRVHRGKRGCCTFCPRLPRNPSRAPGSEMCFPSPCRTVLGNRCPKSCAHFFAAP